jgi:hypothetical protein
MRKIQEQRIKDGICIRCIIQPVQIGKRRCCDCLAKDSIKQSEKRFVNKEKVFQQYGGYVCRCCGETMKECLSIDHMNNNGYFHRKEIGSQGSEFYRWLVKNNFPEGFQVLCMNCQFGKKHNKGICPHQALQSASGRQVVEALQRVQENREASQKTK